MRTFTIVGYWADTGESWVDFVKESTSANAVRKLTRDLVNEGLDVSDLMIVAIFTGRHSDVSQMTRVTEASAFLKSGLKDWRPGGSVR